jgi:hypothetical protein
MLARTDVLDGESLARFHALVNLPIREKPKPETAALALSKSGVHLNQYEMRFHRRCTRALAVWEDFAPPEPGMCNKPKRPRYNNEPGNTPAEPEHREMPTRHARP